MDNDQMKQITDNLENLAFDFVVDLPARDPEAPTEFQVYDESIPYDYECPMCHYRWSGQEKLMFGKGIDDDLTS